MLNGQQGDNADIMLISRRHKATNVIRPTTIMSMISPGHFAIDKAHLVATEMSHRKKNCLSVDFTHNKTDRCQWISQRCHLRRINDKWSTSIK